MLGDCFMRRRQEWGTMAADVDHLVHDLSMDIVGLLWVVVLYQKLAIPPQQGEEEHPHQHQSRQLGSLHAKSVVMMHRPGRYIMGE